MVVGTRTRSTRKRFVIDYADCNEDDEDDDDLSINETALEQAETANKKKKRRTTTKSLPPFEMLPAPAIELIFLCLESARDVYNLDYLTKYLLACLTPEVVVRAAVFGGGKHGEAMGRLIQKVKNKSIHIPSTLRLLRLVNGTMCERGGECFAFNLITNKPAQMKQTASRPYGLMICKACVKGTSCCCDRLVNSERLEVTGRSDNRLLEYSHVEADGEVVGPIVLAHHASQIKHSHRSDEDAMEQAFEALFQTIDENTPTADAVRARALVSAYEEAESHYDAFQASKHEVALNQREKEYANRRKKAQVVYEKLETLLEDYSQKDLVLDCSWRRGYCYFSEKTANALLGPLVRAPSSATKKKMTEAVDAVRKLIHLLNSYGFSGSGQNFLSFLSSPPPSSSEQHYSVKWLRRYCIAELSEDHFQKVLDMRSLGPTFRTLLLDGRPFEALIYALEGSAYRLQLSAVFCRVVKEREPVQRAKLILLARKIWNLNRKLPYTVETEETFKNKVIVCRLEYCTVVASIQDYLADTQTVQFLRETRPPTAYYGFRSITRLVAVDNMYHSETCIRFLQSRDFASLLNLHKTIFDTQRNDF